MIRWLIDLFRPPRCCFCGKRRPVNHSIPACTRCHAVFQAIGRWPGK